MIYLFWLVPGLLIPAQAVSHLKQGLVALNAGQLSEAKQELEQAQKDDSRNPYVWTSLAQTYLRLGNLDRGESAASEAKRLGGTNPVVVHALDIFYFEYAQILLRKEDFTHAASVLRSGLEADPDNVQLTLALGVARYGQRRFDDAIAQFLRTIKLDPSIEQPYLFLGRMLDQAGGHLQEITTDCERWAHDHPENAKAELTLAKALLASDPHSTRAELLLRRSAELSGSDWESHYELGTLLAASHRYEEAAQELKRAIELDANQAQAHYQLARVYDRLGQSDQARVERAIHAQLTNAGKVK